MSNQSNLLNARETNFLEMLVMLLATYDVAIEMLNELKCIEPETYVNAQYMIADIRARIKVYFNG